MINAPTNQTPPPTIRNSIYHNINGIACYAFATLLGYIAGIVSVPETPRERIILARNQTRQIEDFAEKLPLRELKEMLPEIREGINKGTFYDSPGNLVVRVSSEETGLAKRYADAQWDLELLVKKHGDPSERGLSGLVIGGMSYIVLLAIYTLKNNKRNNNTQEKVNELHG